MKLYKVFLTIWDVLDRWVPEGKEAISIVMTNSKGETMLQIEKNLETYKSSIDSTACEGAK